MPPLGGTCGKDFLDFVLKRASEYMDDDFDAILFAGDNCDHGVKGIENIHEIMGNVTDALAKWFPDKIVLNSIGNNDVWKHNNAPLANQSEAYYLDMWGVWFESNPINNVTLAVNKTIEESFKMGGWYAYPIPGKNFTVISLNAMYPFNENWQDVSMSETMMDWLDDYLANSTEKFMIMMHVYPGNNFHGSLEVFWRSKYLKQLHSILSKY